jgi:hypothetical protein
MKMRKKTISLAIISVGTVVSLLLGQKYFAGLCIGLALGLTNDWFLSFTLRWLPSEGALGSFRRAWGWLTPILYLIKQGLFFVALYLIIRSLQLDLLAFALGVMTFQGYRLVLMLFSPERYLQSVFGASIGR